ncbi:MAG: HAMP domain-containing sensor histidine kinase [Marinifilaceae bacterium]
MKVQSRLSLYSSVVFGVVFLFISLLVLLLFYNYTERALYNGMKQTAPLIAFFYLEEDELNTTEFAKVKKQFHENVNNTFYQLYNEKDEIAYGSHYDVIPGKVLDMIRQESILEFTYGDFFCYGIYYSDNQGDFVVIAKEKREVAMRQFYLLSWILLGGLALGILLMVILSRVIAYNAYRPFREVIGQVNKISTESLETKIQLPATNDELEDLVNTFNLLLDKIAKSFIIQRNFVNYVSHEFKTPLASMQGHLEVFQLRPRTPEEYTALTTKLMGQIKDLENILATLITISKVQPNETNVESCRVDELLWEIFDKLKNRFPKTTMNIDITISTQDYEILNVTKPRTQLLIALWNFIENAAKYSNNEPVEVVLSKVEDKLEITITDKGIGIPYKEMEHISKPFYRADNTNKIAGSGIGLSIALQICENNDIHYKINSVQNVGTIITLSF